MAEDKRHIRTCQECGNVQIMKDPGEQKGDKWRDAKCRKCGSEGSLDYGSTQYNCPCGKWCEADECGNCDAMLYACEVDSHVCDPRSV